MRTLQTTDIVSPVKAPITARTLDHINAMVKEPSDEIVKALIGTYTTNDIIILRGCEVTAVIPGTSSVTEGAAYYNGNVYLVDSNASISTSSGQTLVWVVEEDANQAQFSDGVSYDFHITYKLKLQAGASGSGIANYDDSAVKTLYDQVNTGFSVGASTNLSSTSVQGTASVMGNTIVYSLAVSGTTVGAGGWSWDIVVPSRFKAKAQNTGGVGLNPFIGMLVNITDNTSAVYAQNSNNNMAITIQNDGDIQINFGSDLSVGVSKSLKFTFNLTCHIF